MHNPTDTPAQGLVVKRPGTYATEEQQAAYLSGLAAKEPAEYPSVYLVRPKAFEARDWYKKLRMRIEELLPRAILSVWDDIAPAGHTYETVWPDILEGADGMVVAVPPGYASKPETKRRIGPVAAREVADAVAAGLPVLAAHPHFGIAAWVDCKFDAGTRQVRLPWAATPPPPTWAATVSHLGGGPR